MEISRLHMVESIGLIPAIEGLIQDNAICYGLEVHFSHCIQETAVAPMLRNAVLRIIQQCFSNIRRHSHAGCARLKLQQDLRSFRIEVEDQGVGFDPAKVNDDCVGLQWIRQCAAFLGGRACITSLRAKEPSSPWIFLPGKHDPHHAKGRCEGSRCKHTLFAA